MPCLITQFARGYDVLLCVFAAIHSGLHVFGGAFKAVESPCRKTIAGCEECRVSLPHRKAAVVASPILLVGVDDFEFCQFVRFAHMHIPLLHQDEADVQQPVSGCPSFGRDKPSHETAPSRAPLRSISAADADHHQHPYSRRLTAPRRLRVVSTILHYFKVSRHSSRCSPRGR